MNGSLIRSTLLPAVALAFVAAAGCDAGPAPETPPSSPARPAAPTPPKPAPRAAADAPHEAALAALLAAVVTENGLVRYATLAKSEHAIRLATVVDRIASAELPADRNERLALWCNAYNANVLAAVLRERRRPGFESVEKVPGFFDQKIRVAGETLSLNDLENKRIRPLGDPRIHAALVCAAKSCPPLRRKPYVAARLDAQLDDQCKRWVNDETKFRLVDGAVGLSEILKWYGADFDQPPYGNAIGFVLAYAEPTGPIARYIVTAEPPKKRWITYDWALNDASAAAGGS
jgi:hypothetical protein